MAKATFFEEEHLQGLLSFDLATSNVEMLVTSYLSSAVVDKKKYPFFTSYSNTWIGSHERIALERVGMETGMGKLRSLLQFNGANFIPLCGALRQFARLMSELAW